MVDTVLYLAYTAAYAALLAWGVHERRRHDHPLLRPSALALLVAATLVYDNAVVGLGRFVGTGPALEALSLGRYWAHALVTPLLVLFCWAVLARAGLRAARTRAALGAALALTVALVAVEVATVTWGVALEPVREHGTLRYQSAGETDGPPAMVLVVTLVLVATGAWLWWRTRWPWMFLGAAVMAAGSAVPVPVDSSAATNGFELVLLLSLVATMVHQDRSAGTLPDGTGGRAEPHPVAGA